MEEKSENDYMGQKVRMAIGFMGVKSVFTGGDSPLQGEDITGKLEYESGGFYIVTSEGEKIPILGNDCLLTDPAWREEKIFGNHLEGKILDRYGNGQEVVWHGQIQDKGFLPYMAEVCTAGETLSNKFYSGDNSLILGVLDRVLKN
ncbi:hypothetical protein HOA91_02915 [Candidatus Woesearchaeota archaeon]|jgi:hypothetical protein|nr:hypothetical protein [Candidatus Woesearchaeota archaeon]